MRPAIAEHNRFDQRGAVVAAGDVGGLAAKFERELERRHIVGHCGDGDNVVAVLLQRIHIRPGRSQRTHGVVLGEMGSSVQGRALVAVTRIHLCAACDQRFDVSRAVAQRRCEQALVLRKFATGRRDLSLRIQHDDSQRTEQRA